MNIALWYLAVHLSEFSECIVHLGYGEWHIRAIVNHFLSSAALAVTVQGEGRGVATLQFVLMAHIVATDTST